MRYSASVDDVRVHHGTLVADLVLPHAQSMKDRRQALRSLVQRLRNRRLAVARAGRRGQVVGPAAGEPEPGQAPEALHELIGQILTGGEVIADEPVDGVEAGAGVESRECEIPP